MDQVHGSRGEPNHAALSFTGSIRSSSAAIFCRAVRTSKLFCRLSRSAGVVPNACDGRKPEPAVTPICSFASRSIRVRGTPQALARAPGDSPIGTRNSSRRTSPGCSGGSFFAIYDPPWSGRQSAASVLLVIINEFNVLWTLRGPDKANPELVVHADRMLPATIAFQGLKPIGGRYPQIVQCGCGGQINQVAPRHPDQISRGDLSRFIVENCLGQGGFLAPYHRKSVSI